MNFGLEHVTLKLWGSVDHCEYVPLQVVPVVTGDYCGACIFRVHIPPLTLVEFDGHGMSITSSIIVEDEAVALWGETLQYLLF